MVASGKQSAGPHRPSEILDTLKRLGFGVAIAVPDSWLGEILVQIEHEPTMRLVRAMNRSHPIESAEKMCW